MSEKNKKIIFLLFDYTELTGWNEKWRTKLKKAFVTVDFHDGPKFKMHQLRSPESPLVDLFYSPTHTNNEKARNIFITHR